MKAGGVPITVRLPRRSGNPPCTADFASRHAIAAIMFIHSPITIGIPR